MIKFDSHVHTEYCGHANGMSIKAIAEQADKLGLESLLIVEHIFGPDDIDLLDKINYEVIEHRGKCEILVGSEVDVDPMKTDGSFVASDELIGRSDLVIGAVHYIPTVGNYPHGIDDNPLEPQELLEYWRSSLLGMLENSAVDILAHPGRLPSASLDLNIFIEDVISVLEEAAEISAKNNIFWEINNLTGARLNTEIFEHWHRTIQVAIDAGVKITFGSDAHELGAIATQGYTQQILKKLDGFDKLYSPVEILRERHGAKK